MSTCHRTMRIHHALTAAASIALAACSSSNKATPTTTDAGVGGAMAIFNTGPDAAHLTRAGDGAVPECGGFGRGAATCKACLQKSCCDAATSCARTGGCTQNAACIQACDGKRGDAGAACEQACADQYFAAAGSQYNALIACMSSACSKECPFSGP